MGDWGIPISILLFYVVLLICINLWFEELMNIKFIISLYLFITCIAIKWCFYLGSKGYFIRYRSSKDELGEERIIEFPVIWM